MSAERDALHRLVEELPEDQVSIAFADVRRHVRPAKRRSWPPAWFGAATAPRSDPAARAEELPAEGFDRSE